MIDLDHLTVSGDVYFGKNITLRGTVIGKSVWKIITSSKSPTDCGCHSRGQRGPKNLHSGWMYSRKS